MQNTKPLAFDLLRNTHDLIKARRRMNVIPAVWSPERLSAYALLSKEMRRFVLFDIRHDGITEQRIGLGYPEKSDHHGEIVNRFLNTIRELDLSSQVTAVGGGFINAEDEIKTAYIIGYLKYRGNAQQSDVSSEYPTSDVVDVIRLFRTIHPYEDYKFLQATDPEHSAQLWRMSHR